MPHPTRHAQATSVAASTTFSRSSRRRTRMKTIDIHAHLVPRSLWQAAEAGREWHGFRHEPGDGIGSMLGGGQRISFTSPKVRFTPEERLKDMDSQGVDVQVVSIHTPFFGYHLDSAPGRALAPPPKSGPSNSLGVILHDAIVVAILIFGVLEACPTLKPCIAPGGGPACYAMGRLDRGWQRMPAERRSIPMPPSSYQRRLYYDTVVGSEKALRFLIDEVGVDRVVLGSDWPFVPWHPSPVTWVQGLKTITPEAKKQILWRNLESLLKL